MYVSEDTFTKVEGLFEDAVFGLVGWDDAVGAMASALNSRTGQLIGLGRAATLPFNVMTEIPPEALEEFEASGGADPWVNSRVRLGMAAPELQLVDDAQFTFEQDRTRAPEFGAWIDRYSVGYTCLANLIRRDDMVIGTAIIRDQRQDGMGADEKRAVHRLVTSLRRAVRLQMELEGQQTRMIAGAFELLDGHAFICGEGGRLIGLSPAAERLVAETRWLAIRDGCLVARESASAKALATQLTGELAGSDCNAIVVHDETGAPLYLEICPFPIGRSIAFAARTLVIARPRRSRERQVAALARALYRLTAMEATVASYTADGKSPQRIAEFCGTSVGTVRTHLKRIFDKTGARSQVELAALLTSYL